MSYETPTGREFLFGTLRKLKALAPEAPLDRAALEAADGRWTQPATRQVLKRAVGPATASTCSRRSTSNGTTGPRPVDFRPEGGLYRTILLRTLAIGAATTLACMLLAFLLCAYPGAGVRAPAQPPPDPGAAAVWTSILVRMTAWIVLPADRGVANDAAVRRPDRRPARAAVQPHRGHPGARPRHAAVHDLPRCSRRCGPPIRA